MPTIKQHSSWSLPQQKTVGTVSPHIMPTMLWIKTHQKRARFIRHQSVTTTVVEIVLLSKSTLQPDEDLQSRLKCCNQYLSDNRQTNNKWNPLYTFCTMNNIFHDNEEGCWEKCLMVHASSLKVCYFSKSGKSSKMAGNAVRISFIASIRRKQKKIWQLFLVSGTYLNNLPHYKVDDLFNY